MDESYELFLSSGDSERPSSTSASASAALDTAAAIASSSSAPPYVLAEVSAVTAFGAGRAMEALADLAVFDETTQALEVLRRAFVRDAPAHPIRGALLDVSRRFVHSEIKFFRLFFFSKSCLKALLYCKYMDPLHFTSVVAVYCCCCSRCCCCSYYCYCYCC